MVHQPAVELGTLLPCANQEQCRMRERQGDVLSPNISKALPALSLMRDSHPLHS